MTDRVCPQCNASNPADQTFCRQCGTSLPAAADAPDGAPAAAPPEAQRMPTPAGNGTRGWLVVAALVVLAVIAFISWRAFGNAPELGTPAGDSVSHQLTQTRTIDTEKDSLMSELLETTTLLTDIDQAVTAVQNGRNAPILAESGPHPMTAKEARLLLLPKIDSLRQRLEGVQNRLSASLDRVKQLTGTESQLRHQIAEYEATVASVRKLLAAQQEQLTSLNTEVESLKAENRQLLDVQGTIVASRDALQDSMTDLKESANTGYWIAGSKSALLELGIVVEEGGGKVLVFGKGKSVVPARSFHASDFNPVNKRQTTVITLPKPNTRYRILTRQDLSVIKNALDHDGHVRGTIEISDTDKFWESSPYLILIED